MEQLHLKLKNVMPTTTLKPIVITPDQVVTDSIIDLSGQVLIDANTGNAYNIDDVDVSQFTDVFIVNATSDNPLQNYQPVTLKLLDADDVLPIKKEQIDQPSVVLQEVKVHVQNGKNQGTEIIEISSESDNVSSEKRDVADEVRKSDGITEERDAEKCDESESDVPDEVGKSDVSKKRDGKETEKRKPDEEVGKGNVVEKRDGITDNDNEKSDVGENRDVITEEKHDVVKKHDGITNKLTCAVPDVGEKRVHVITEEKDDEKCDVVKKRDGITDNDNAKSDVLDVGKKRDVITEEKDDEKCDVRHEVGTEEDDTEKHGEVRKAAVGEKCHGITNGAVESDVGKKSMEILDAADVGKENNKEPDAVLGCDVITKQVQVQEDKHDVTTPAEEKDAEKSNITKPDEVGKSDVSEIERRSEKKTNSSDSYDSETEDTTAVSSGITNNLTITDNRDVQERPESPTNNLTTTDKRDVQERPESPDNLVVHVSTKACRIKDQVPSTRKELRTQYQCNLARKFVKTDYKYKSPNVGPELDVFEDEEDFSEYNSDTTFHTGSASTTSTTSESCVGDSENSEESVLYVMF